MDYSDINNFLKNLELKKDNKSYNFEKQIDDLNKNKIQTSEKILNRHFDFVSNVTLPQNNFNDKNINNNKKNIVNTSSENRNDLFMNRNHIPIMDYNNFSENYKNKGNYLDDKINENMNNRENIPYIEVFK